jgi:hypothetical protein
MTKKQLKAEAREEIMKAKNIIEATGIVAKYIEKAHTLGLEEGQHIAEATGIAVDDAVEEARREERKRCAEIARSGNIYIGHLTKVKAEETNIIREAVARAIEKGEHE